MAEPHDNHTYNIRFFDITLKFYLNALNFYKSFLESDVKAIDEDPDLKAILGDYRQEQLEIHRELERVESVRKWIEERLNQNKETLREVVEHRLVRFLKSVGNLYINHLQIRRNRLAARPNVSKYTLKDVDQKLAAMREKITTGVFDNATFIPLLVDQLTPTNFVVTDDSDSLAVSRVPRPVLIESIEILDGDLRSRCLDIFNMFEGKGQRDRLDTVISEATRIFEDKLRRLCGAPEDVSGVDLATYAFSGKETRLVISNVAAEQEATHLLFRGVFGSIRNMSHHKLLGELQPERVIQVLGMLDYCLGIAQSAQKREPTSNEPSAG